MLETVASHASRTPVFAATFAVIAVLQFVGLASAEERGSIPPEVRRVVFLGDSITYGGQYVSDVEAYFVTRYPARRIEFINVGLPSETVSGLSEPGHAGGKFPRPDLHERLTRVMEQTKPDLVFACYGMNDGIYLPLDGQRFENFKDGVTWLHEQVTKAGAKIMKKGLPLKEAEAQADDLETKIRDLANAGA